MTREELQKSELPIFQSERAHLAQERGAAGVSPYVVGLLNFQMAISWLVVYRDFDGAKDFLDGAAFQLQRDIERCSAAAQRADELHACFGSHIRGFFVHSLPRPDERRWPLFESSLDLFARAIELSPLETDAKSVTPLVMFTAGLAALAAIDKRSVPSPLLHVAKAHPVTAGFRKLREALTLVIADPTPESCAGVRKAYRAAISLADYRPPLTRGLMLTELLSISAVAEGGDILQGAFTIFE